MQHLSLSSTTSRIILRFVSLMIFAILTKSLTSFRGPRPVFAFWDCSCYHFGTCGVVCEGMGWGQVGGGGTLTKGKMGRSACSSERDLMLKKYERFLKHYAMKFCLRNHPNQNSLNCSKICFFINFSSIFSQKTVLILYSSHLYFSL